ncbi:MAG: universal stress protein [Alphaproteobacteria bacterium]|nr:universal stress protein [Alphaproteobacteria bacterium]
MFKSVLVALDETPLSEKVLAAALRVVEPADGKIWALRIRPDAASLEGDAALLDLDTIEAETAELLRKVLVSPSYVADRRRVEAEVRTGGIVDAILGAAEDHECDAIVMGLHGRKGLTQHLTGSHAEQVVFKAPQSVFVVKAAGYPFLQD